MKILHSYENGNTTVTIYENGTKVREFNDIPKINHPESIDIKITNYCDLNCMYCHENSNVEGKHADLEKLQNILINAKFPKGIELAIGGGNPLSHPDLYPFLQWLKKYGFIANLTVNQKHIPKHFNNLVYLINNDLINGLGISIINNDLKFINKLHELTDHIVYHVIIGILEKEVLDDLIKKSYKKPKVLFLGYKTFGRGISYFNENINENIKLWQIMIKQYFGKILLAFDNLAITQLKLKALFTDKAWDKFYMGDDFTYTMYIDAVNEQYGPTSNSELRYSFDKYSLIEFFNLRNQLAIK